MTLLDFYTTYNVKAFIQYLWNGIQTFEVYVLHASEIFLHCTWSCKNCSFAICTIRSTWIIPPMLGISMSATRVSTMMASTSSCRYSGWGTWFSTDSTCTANLISPSVIYNTCTYALVNSCLIEQLIFMSVINNINNMDAIYQRPVAHEVCASFSCTSRVVEEGRTYPAIERPWHFCRIFHTFW